MDHKINSIQNCIPASTKDRCQMIDANICQEQVFHTKMALNHFDLDDYLFQVSARDPDEEQRHGIGAKLKLEMMEILYGRNM